MKDNGLELKTIQSCVDAESKGYIPAEEERIKDIINSNMGENETAYAMAWSDKQVICGMWKDSGFSFYHPVNDSRPEDGIEPEHIKKLRVFNKDREAYFYRTRNGLFYRVRIDGQGEETDVVIAHQMLIGTKIRKIDSDGYYRLKQEQYGDLVLPLGQIQKNSERVYLITNNYIGRTDLKQATYMDVRFAGFSFQPIPPKGESE